MKTDHQHQEVASRTIQPKRTKGEGAFMVDNREMALSKFVDNRNTAQMRLMSVVQRVGLEEEDSLQMKPVAQLQSEDEELQMKPVAQLQSEDEELQMKPVVQLQSEDEELQMKPVTQLQAEGEELQMKPVTQLQSIEDEELQMKPVTQLQSEDEELQMKPVAQLQSEDEELQMKPVAQLQSEDEELQMKPVAQLQSEDEEILQGKFITQLQSIEDEELLQRKFETIQQKSNNTGLPDSLKSGVESASGISMDDVRVHYNSAKPAQMQAHAYTQGTDIHVASGQEKHLPHEAWHVVQQMQGRVQPTTQLQGVNVNDDSSLEKEADVMGERVIQNKSTQESVKDNRMNGQSPLLKINQGVNASQAILRREIVLANKKTSFQVGINFMPSSSRFKMSIPKRVFRTRHLGSVIAGHTSLISDKLGVNPQKTAVGFSPASYIDSLRVAMGKPPSMKKAALFGMGTAALTLLIGKMGLLPEKLVNTVGTGVCTAGQIMDMGAEEVPGTSHDEKGVTDDPEAVQLVIGVSEETYNRWNNKMGAYITDAIFSFSPDGLLTNNCVTFALRMAHEFCNEQIDEKDDPISSTDKCSLGMLRARIVEMKGIVAIRRTGLQGAIMRYLKETFG